MCLKYGRDTQEAYKRFFLVQHATDNSHIHLRSRVSGSYAQEAKAMEKKEHDIPLQTEANIEKLNNNNNNTLNGQHTYI